MAAQLTPHAWESRGPLSSMHEGDGWTTCL